MASWNGLPKSHWRGRDTEAHEQRTPLSKGCGNWRAQSMRCLALIFANCSSVTRTGGWLWPPARWLVMGDADHLEPTTRCTTLVPTPMVRAIFKIPIPVALSSRMWASTTGLTRRPTVSESKDLGAEHSGISRANKWGFPYNSRPAAKGLRAPQCRQPAELSSSTNVDDLRWKKAMRSAPRPSPASLRASSEVSVRRGGRASECSGSGPFGGQVQLDCFESFFGSRI